MKRGDIVTYIRELPFDVDLSTLPNRDDKSQRGWYNKITARLLTPRRLRDAFDKDPDRYVLLRCSYVYLYTMNLYLL